MADGKQFTLYTHDLTPPNGWKVVLVLEELGLTYETRHLDFKTGEHKGAAHVALNPNGRIPTLVDHANGDFVVWESDAILLYLVGRYDKERKLSVEDENGRAEVVQWLFFQSSGQGPYFGQAYHFQRVHPVPVPTAVARYTEEVLRVFGVLDSVLAGRAWLVGGKCTIADLAFLHWNALGLELVHDVDVQARFPAMYAWHRRMTEREPTKTVLARQAALIAASKKPAA